MNTFTIYPAIDLRQGKVVRLTQGDPSRQTVFSDDPAQAALRWLQVGAGWLHVVNLDGAFEAEDSLNRAAVASILQVVEQYGSRAFVQLGGGLRTLAGIQQAFEAGVQRLVLGTAAVYNPEILTAALDRWGAERIAVAVDAVDGIVQARGWLEATGVETIVLGARLAGMGVRTLIYTNIARDGTGAGIDLPTAQQLALASGLDVIASGGASSLEDVRLVKAAGLSGVIIGRALYDGRIDLKEALAC